MRVYTLLLLALFAFTTAPAMAQSKLAKARTQYKECQSLLDSDKGCEAKAACEKGLSIKELAPLVELTQKAREACKSEKAKKAKKKRKKRADEVRTVESSCPNGMRITADTLGQCCYPGQVWNGEKCVGVPTECPDSYNADPEAETCAKATCDDEGRVLTADSKGCCWPGQGFSSSTQACVGKPECPKGYTRNANECERLPDDRDADSIVDAEDQCPDVPEDFDGFQDEDGCIDPDNDGDGLCDNTLTPIDLAHVGGQCSGRDSCPGDAEDLDGFEDGDGCPELDNDRDTIVDTEDQCIQQPEDFDDFEDADGCPDIDNDNDGLLDEDDQCPDEAEDFDGTQDQDGCPEETAQELAALQNPKGDDGNGLLIGGIVTASLGVLILGGGAGMQVYAESLRDQVRNAETLENSDVINGEKLSQVEAQQLQEDANLFDTLGAVGYGLGGALLVTGVTLVIIDVTGGESDDDDDAQTELTPSILLDHQTLFFSLGGRF